MSTYHLPALIALCPFLGAFTLPLIAWKWPKSARPISLFALIGASIASAIAFAHVLEQGPIMYALGGWAAPFGIEWRLDGLSALVCLVVSISAVIIFIGIKENVLREFEGREIPFYTCILLMIGGLFGIVLSADLFNLFVFLEVASLSTYALIGASSGRGMVAAYRYLLIGTVGATLYLFGVGFFYAATGTLNMPDAAARISELSNSLTVLIGVSLIVVGLCIKSAILPLHGWLPESYAYSSNSVAAMVAPLMTKVSIYAMIRILGWVALPWWDAQSMVMIAIRTGAIAAIILGPLAARVQTDFRRLLAYSSIGQAGLIVLGISFASNLGLTGALLHLINDIFAKSVLFLTACVIALKLDVHKVTGLARIREPMGWFWVMFVIAALSMVGIPPTLGFFSKWYLILAALEQGLWPIAALIIASALLSASYVFVLLEQIFRKPASTTEEDDSVPVKIPWVLTLATGAFVIGIITLGFFNQSLAKTIMNTAMPGTL